MNMPKLFKLDLDQMVWYFEHEDPRLWASIKNDDVVLTLKKSTCSGLYYYFEPTGIEVLDGRLSTGFQHRFFIEVIS